MTTTNQDDLEARAALAELNDATSQSEAALSDTPADPSAVVLRVIEAVSESQVERLRNKAKLERQRGAANLSRRHHGIASVLANIQIRERVVASAFERYFSTIESGIHVVLKRGHMFVSDKQAEQIADRIVEMIGELEERIAGDLARVKMSLDVHASRADFVTPTYTSPAADHEVQLRTKLAKRVLDVFRQQDEYVVILNQLAWNDEVDPDAVDMAEAEIKKEMRTLSTFLFRTMRNMRQRVADKVEAAAAAPEAGAETPVAEAA